MQQKEEVLRKRRKKVMAKKRTRKNNFRADDIWDCTWEDKYGGWGTLDECIEMISNYICSGIPDEIDEHGNLVTNCLAMNERLASVREECLTKGRAGVEGWWSISYS